MGAAVLIGFNALASFVIWVLGVGVPHDFHMAMGLWFLALNLSAAVQFVRAPEPKPIRLIASLVAVVPLAVLSIFAAGSMCDLLTLKC